MRVTEQFSLTFIIAAVALTLVLLVIFGVITPG